MVKARALQFTAPRLVAFTTVEIGDPAPGQVLVRTAYSGISGGTEMLAYRGELDPKLPLDDALGALSGTFRFPFGYGYSCVGVVEQSAAHLEPGTLVFAFHPHQDRFLIDETDLVRLPGDLDPRVATLFPLLETALQLTIDAGPVFGEPVVVTGLGTVGILTALLLQRAGARVISGEPTGWRRELAGSLGIDAVPPDDLAGRVAAITGGRGVPLLVEVSGSPQALAGGLALLAHEGLALVGSWYGTKPVTLPLGAQFHRRRLTIRSSQVSTVPARHSGRWTIERRRSAALAALAELPAATLATGEFAFEEAALAYAAIDRGERGLLHVALRYD